jgi:hypothetical protein
MDIHITTNNPSESLRLFVNNRLIGELAVEVFDDRDTLAQQVTAARCLEKLPLLLAALAQEAAWAHRGPDHALPTTEAREAAYLRGLVAGLQGETVPYPGSPLLPGIPPEATRSYERGWEAGMGLYGVCQAYRQAAAAIQQAAPAAQIA